MISLLIVKKALLMILNREETVTVGRAALGPVTFWDVSLSSHRGKRAARQHEMSVSASGYCLVLVRVAGRPKCG